MTEYNFTESADHEKGFARVFHDRIVPILRHHETRRKEYRKKALTGMGVSGAGGVGAAGAGVSYESEYGFVGGVLGGVGAFGVKAYYENKWQSGLGGEILPILCEFLGEMEYGRQEISTGLFEKLGVVPNFDTSSVEDPVTGRHADLNWAMTEATLKTKSRDSKGRTRTTTVFRGLLFQIEIHGPAPRIFFGKDRGGMLNWFSETFSGSRKGMAKLEIGSPEFQEVYEVYTSDELAAQRFINERLTDGLMEIARIEGGKKYISCAMEGDHLYLALPRGGDFLGLGSLFKPLTKVENDLHEALADLDLPRRVIDRLKGA